MRVRRLAGSAAIYTGYIVVGLIYALRTVGM